MTIREYLRHLVSWLLAFPTRDHLWTSPVDSKTEQCLVCGRVQTKEECDEDFCDEDCEECDEYEECCAEHYNENED